jgi:outer membrane protein assembly factor BamA
MQVMKKYLRSFLQLNKSYLLLKQIICLPNLFFCVLTASVFYVSNSLSKATIPVFIKLLLAITFIYLTPAVAQQKYSLSINGLPSATKLAYKQSFSDSLKTIGQADSVINQLQLNGYFNCNVYKFEWLKSHLTVQLNSGVQYNWAYIKNGNINPNALNFDKLYQNKHYNAYELKTMYHQILAWYENNGYPFAQVWLDSFTFNKNAIAAKFYCKPNKKIYIDSILIIGNAKLSASYIYACLDIKPNNIYQENKIAFIDKRLQNLSIITLLRYTEITFVDDKATINLYIDQKNANQFDGIIGFLPSPDGKNLQLTGDFKLKLQNTLKRGELIDLNYRGLPNQSQQLLAKVNYPYLLISKIGLDFDFQLFKKDTSFLNLSTKLGFAYAFTPEKTIHLFIENYNGNLINNSNTATNTALPLFANIATTYYGIGTNIEKTDNALQPTKGYKINMMASVGERTIYKTKDFNPISFPNIALQSTQYKLNFDFNYYLKLAPKFVLYLHPQASLISGNQIFENEAFRIGGFKILRGFNEQSILASSYLVHTLEPRYFIEKKSFLFVFYDQAFIQQSFVNGKKTQNPLGLGAGINFETKLGFMSLSYALGKQQNNPLNLRTGKIHFGLISYF